MAPESLDVCEARRDVSGPPVWRACTKDGTASRPIWVLPQRSYPDVEKGPRTRSGLTSSVVHVYLTVHIVMNA